MRYSDVLEMCVRTRVDRRTGGARLPAGKTNNVTLFVLAGMLS